MTIGSTEHVILIDAPFEDVWRETNNVRAWPTLFSEYASAEILEERDGYVKFRLTTHPDENGKAWSWVSERSYSRPTGVVDAQRVETGPFEYMNIRWEYREVDGGVEMRWKQDFRMRPAAPVDDETMTARINARSPREMSRIKEIIESGYARRTSEDKPGAQEE